MVRVSGTLDPVTLRRFTISPSPTFVAKITTESGTWNEEVVVDTGCTGEVIINERCAQEIGAVIKPSHVKTARMADNSSTMTILGETTFLG